MYKFTKLFFSICALALMLNIFTPTTNSVQAAGTCESQYACNCVLWVKCARVPSLPSGMTDLAGKKKGINSYTPTVGSVAIMNVGTWGHVAYVSAVNRDRSGNVVSITVEEANYSYCKLGTRTDSPARMKVVGYYRP
jgi:CHAP domain